MFLGAMPHLDFIHEQHGTPPLSRDQRAVSVRNERIRSRDINVAAPRPRREPRDLIAVLTSAAALIACTAKATMYCASGLAAFIGAMVAGYVMGRRVGGVVVDFRTFTMIGGG